MIFSTTLDKISKMSIGNCKILGQDFFWVFMFIVFFFCCFPRNCNAVDRIRQGEGISDGETIISAGAKFELGFFSPGNNIFRYVGIWYYGVQIQSVIWVANRDNPISGNSGVLTVGNNGNLEVIAGNGTIVWSSNVTSVSSESTAVLMDSGDLVLYKGGNASDSGNSLWESFKNPTDSYVPGMRVDVNARNGEYRVYSSWKTATDPSPGNYSMGIDPRLSPQIVIWEGRNRHWRSGHWTGLIFTGVPEMRSFYLYGFHLVIEDGRTYFTYTPANSSDIFRFLISWNGVEQQLRWDQGSKTWMTIQAKPSNECEIYSQCGVFGVCNVDKSPICSCIEGFEPSDWYQWSKGNWSSGCLRRKQLKCGGNGSISEGNDAKEDGFRKIEGVKMPDYLDSLGTEDREGCERKCLSSCSCIAYASVSGLNCMIWSGDLIDIQQFAEGGNTLYVRLPRSELGNKSKVGIVILISLLVVGIACLIVSVCVFMCYNGGLRGIPSWRRNKGESAVPETSRNREHSTDLSGQDGRQGPAPELAMFSLSTMATATNNFSDENKLGQGGFGPVYRGILSCGQEIAVKRLSRRSGQGIEELKNEITLIAKLQHRNLVRLLGCCIEREEKMLLYEYMPNKSLDTYLFDASKQAELDWRKRFVIIEGIARGLVYLHRDSRLRIIHRDLKASNILLDEEMNPKISDFGMARIFGRDQNEANTVRVVGTYGYMSPEYAMEGLFSVKSDVYSFGVLLLEIVSGRKNSSFRSPEYSNLIGHAWDLWERGKALELTDPSIVSSSCSSEVLKCVHIAILCVQDMASERPDMSAVVVMLDSESVTIPVPKKPTFTSMKTSADADLLNRNRRPDISKNDVTISTVVGR